MNNDYFALNEQKQYEQSLKRGILYSNDSGGLLLWDRHHTLFIELEGTNEAGCIKENTSIQALACLLQ